MMAATKTLLAMLALLSGPALAAPPDPGAITVLAENCAICHGPMGRGAGEIKAIGGRKVEDLLPLLIGFRDGTTPTTLMQRLMTPLTDDELAALAAEIAQWK